MRLKHLTISALSLSIFFSANVYGGEDVIVDLSVLNSLQPSTAPMPSYGKSEKPQPLFPIVKKETAKTKKAEQASPSQSKTKKTIAKKVQQQPSIVKSKDKALASDSPKKETLKIIETAKTENSEIKPQKEEQIKVETQVLNFISSISAEIFFIALCIIFSNFGEYSFPSTNKVCKFQTLSKNLEHPLMLSIDQGAV